jgi:hypothetical protein
MRNFQGRRESGGCALIQVLDASGPPFKRTRAKRAQIAVITLLGVGLVLLLVIFIRDNMRNDA